MKHASYNYLGLVLMTIAEIGSAKDLKVQCKGNLSGQINIVGEGLETSNPAVSLHTRPHEFAIPIQGVPGMAHAGEIDLSFEPAFCKTGRLPIHHALQCRGLEHDKPGELILKLGNATKVIELRSISITTYHSVGVDFETLNLKVVAQAVDGGETIQFTQAFPFDGCMSEQNPKP